MPLSARDCSHVPSQTTPSSSIRAAASRDDRRSTSGSPVSATASRVTISSGIDEHHGFARYAWTIGAADGDAILEGIDIVERGENNRLRRVVMFFGPLPQATE